MSDNRNDGEAIAASLTEPRAFGVIFERHFGAIHGYLRRRFDDQLADELTGQTFLAAFDGRARFDLERSDSRPWLFGIATNLAHRHRRSELRELRAIAALTPDPGAGVEGVEARLRGPARRRAAAGAARPIAR